MSIKLIPLSSLKADPIGIVSECIDSGQPLAIVLGRPPRCVFNVKFVEDSPMSLCLIVFGSDIEQDDDPEEIAECDVGHYSDFGCFRDTIARHLDPDRFPTLMEHSDCDGEWTLEELPALEHELQEIGAAFRKLPPEQPAGGSSTQPSTARRLVHSTTAFTTSMAKTCSRRFSACARSPESTNVQSRSCRFLGKCSTRESAFMP